MKNLREIAHRNVEEALWKGWTFLLCHLSPIYGRKEGVSCRAARLGKLGCFYQKAPPSVGTPWKAQVGLVTICTPLFTKYTLFVFFCWFLSVTLWNFTDYVTTPIFFPECCETLWILQQCPFWLPKCCGTLRIAQQCFLLTSGMLRNFTDYLTMGVKYLEVVKRRLHATKQWSPDEIRVW